jgi:hypothetical protein
VFLRGKIIYHQFKMSRPHRNAISFDRPATYQIMVQGRVDPNWSDLMSGMAICLTISETNPPVSTLQGELSDQAALAGVLNSLYELHLPVLSVVCQSYSPASDKTEINEVNPSEDTISENKDKAKTT